MNDHIGIPIGPQWTTEPHDFVGGDVPCNAKALAEHLTPAATAVGSDLVPFLAASAAELCEQSGLRWRTRADSVAVSALRTIARVAITHPEAGGVHTMRALQLLRDNQPAPDPQIGGMD